MQHTCTIPGCSAPVVSYGLCDKHRKRKQRYGDPLATKRIIGDIEARWWSYVDRRGADECWPWTGGIDDDGYGRFWDGQRAGYAPRWGYERFVAPIPTRHMPDHLCRHRWCVNWAHLEPVTNRENVLRGARTKLTDNVVSLLLEAHRQTGVSVAELASIAGVNKTTLYRRFRRLG